MITPQELRAAPFDATTIAEWSRRLTRYFFALGAGPLAEDLAQDVLLVVVKRQDAVAVISPSERILWMFGVARMIWRRKLSDDRREREPMLLLNAPAAGKPFDAQIADRLMLDAALRPLSPRQREVVIQRHVEGRTVPEIATLIGLNVSTVRVHLDRGMRKLRQFFQGELQ